MASKSGLGSCTFWGLTPALNLLTFLGLSFIFFYPMSFDLIGIHLYVLFMYEFLNRLSSHVPDDNTLIEADDNEKAINILLLGQSDGRHVLKTLEEHLNFRTTKEVKINVRQLLLILLFLLLYSSSSLFASQTILCSVLICEYSSGVHC